MRRCSLSSVVARACVVNCRDSLSSFKMSVHRQIRSGRRRECVPDALEACLASALWLPGGVYPHPLSAQGQAFTFPIKGEGTLRYPICAVGRVID